MLVLTKYGRSGASSRMRTYQFGRFFAEVSQHNTYSELVRDSDLLQKYKTGRYLGFLLVYLYVRRLKVLMLSPFEVVWVEKELFRWVPFWFELLLLRKKQYILDFDDADFHLYDLNSNFILRFFFRKKIDRLMKYSALVVCGNRYLASRAISAGAARVELVPTVVDLMRYRPRVFDSGVAGGRIPRIVWIGSPSTVKYLRSLSSAFTELSKRKRFILRVIGGGSFEAENVDVECFPWSEETEADDLASCDIGIMPLLDSPWERGKCGYKLIQYMASGLPTVASAVGANLDITLEGQTGYLVTSDDEWINALDRLLSDVRLRACMGEIGRNRVASFYSLQAVGPKIVKLIREVSSSR